VIYFLTTRDHTYTLDNARQAIGPTLTVRSYEWLFGQKRLPAGTWVFTDHDRLAGHELAWAAVAATALVAAGNRVLNRPADVLTRFELVAKLRADGLNDIGAWRANETPRPDRFPVLLKSDHDHLQSHAGLIADQTSLDAKLAELRQQGIPLRHLLVVSYANDPIRPGTWRKHSVFRAGARLLPYSPVIENNWAAKYGTAGHATDAELSAAVLEMNENPYAAMMKPVFDAAGIDFGRVDFGFADGKPAVYEINTNPYVPKHMTGHRRQDYQTANNLVLDRIYASVLELETAGTSANVPWPASAQPRGWLRREFRPPKP
jgi:hypothetical protein